MAVDRIAVNTALTALVEGFGRPLTEADDDALNDLTHTVADFIDRTYVLAEPNTLGAETDDNEERGDICMALREAGFGYEADDVGGYDVEGARSAYQRLTGKTWVWNR